jgi:hypothetical protein
MKKPSFVSLRVLFTIPLMISIFLLPGESQSPVISSIPACISGLLDLVLDPVPTSRFRRFLLVDFSCFGSGARCPFGLSVRCVLVSNEFFPARALSFGS